jgi:hypothetical protein
MWSYKVPVPASAANGYISAQESARRQRKAEKENSARWAVSEHQVKTLGTGNIRQPEPLMFEVKFLQEPQFTSGVALSKHPNPTDWHDPAGDALVRSWVRDPNGAYVGAWLSYRVEIDPIAPPAVDPDPVVALVHFLTFSGLAYKAIEGIDLDDITPNTVQF